jgi:hypothetical protein
MNTPIDADLELNSYIRERWHVDFSLIFFSRCAFFFIKAQNSSCSRRLLDLSIINYY